MVLPAYHPQVLDAAHDLLRDKTRILVFTGAGISTESGIPDFRGPDGLWTKVDPDDFTIQRYVTSTEIRRAKWRMQCSAELWGSRSTARPNPGHLAVADLARQGRLAGCVTQNVDGLHHQAGLGPDLLAEVHGHVRTCRCLGCGLVLPTDQVLTRVDGGDDDPHCLECGGLLKTSVVMFGEALPESEVAKAIEFAEVADAVVAVGTTMSVFPATDFALAPVHRGAPLIIVNQGPTEADHLAKVLIDQGAGTALPRLFSV